MSFSVTLYHTNDMHDHRESFPVLARLPRHERTLLVDIGDSLKGSNTLWYWNEPIMDAMNRAGYQVQAMGNREFHYLRSVLKHRAAMRRFPILAANLVDVRHPRPACWERSVVLQAGRWRVGLTGVTPVQFTEDSPWYKIFGFRFDDPAEALRPVLKELRKRCHLVVLLSHVGYEADQRLAAAGLDADIIIGGHSHTLLRQADCRQAIPIVHAGSHGRFVGETTLHLSPAGALRSFDYALNGHESTELELRPLPQ